MFGEVFSFEQLLGSILLRLYMFYVCMLGSIIELAIDLISFSCGGFLGGWAIGDIHTYIRASLIITGERKREKKWQANSIQSKSASASAPGSCGLATRALINCFRKLIPFTLPSIPFVPCH